MNATATSSQKEKETQKENKIQIKPETVVLLPNLIAHASITNVSEKKKSEKKMSASSINTTEKKMNLNTAEKKKAVAVAINTLINTVSVEKKKEKKTIEKLNKKIVVENVDCFITPTDDDVCYNALKNQKLLVKGVKIRYRHAQYTYKKKENDFCVGVIDRVRLSKSPSEKKRGSWVKDYDTNYVVIVKEKKKGQKTTVNVRNVEKNYITNIIVNTNTIDELYVAMMKDLELKKLMKHLHKRLNLTTRQRKLLGMNKEGEMITTREQQIHLLSLSDDE